MMQENLGSKKRWQRLFFIPLTLIFVISFTLIGTTADNNQPKSIVSIGSVQEIHTVNPLVELSLSYCALRRWIYDSLYKDGPNFTVIPNLAKEISVSNDGKIYTFKIRKNAEFQDGTPLTAYDIAFTHNYIIKNQMGFYTEYTDPMEEVKALGPYTLQIKFEEKINRTWLDYNTFFWVPILPKHIWEHITKEEALGELPLEKLIGSGPYQLIEYKPDEVIRLRATPKAKKELNLKVDEIIFKMYANTPSMLQDLKAGNIDMVDQVPEKVASLLEKIPTITLYTGPALNRDYVAFNSWPNAYGKGKKKHPHPALKDVKVREALDWVLDERMFAKVAHGRYATPGNAWLAPGDGEFQNTSLKPRGFDLDKAKQILNEAGYKDTDGDGIRETKDGLPLIFDVWFSSTSYYAYDADVASLWAREAKKVGIKLNISAMTNETLTTREMSGDYDIVIWAFWGEQDPNFILSVLTSGQAFESGWNETGFSNPEYDRLYKQQREAASFEERKNIIWRMQEIIHEEIPYIAYAYRMVVGAIRNDRVKINPAFAGAVRDLLGRVVILNMEKITK